MRRLLRDADGFVHTPRGYISGESYDKMREANPNFQYPLRSDIPLMSDLSDDDLKSWYPAPEQAAAVAVATLPPRLPRRR